MRTVAIPGYEKGVKNYVAALQAVDLAPVVTLDVQTAAACDGLLLPGGGDMDPVLFGQPDRGSRDIDRPLDEIQLAALDAFVRAERPVLGICRGHQVINVYFGGDLIQDLPTAGDHMAHDRADSLHAVRFRPGTLLHRLYGPEAVVNSAHHQGLGAMGKGLTATAEAPDGVIEAAEHESMPVLGVQFHPERIAFAFARPAAADGRRIFQWFKETLG